MDNVLHELSRQPDIYHIKFHQKYRILVPPPKMNSYYRICFDQLGIVRLAREEGIGKVTLLSQ